MDLKGLTLMTLPKEVLHLISYFSSDKTWGVVQRVSRLFHGERAEHLQKRRCPNIWVGMERGFWADVFRMAPRGRIFGRKTFVQNLYDCRENPHYHPRQLITWLTCKYFQLDSKYVWKQLAVYLIDTCTYADDDGIFYMRYRDHMTLTTRLNYIGDLFLRKKYSTIRNIRETDAVEHMAPNRVKAELHALRERLLTEIHAFKGIKLRISMPELATARAVALEALNLLRENFDINEHAMKSYKQIFDFKPPAKVPPQLPYTPLINKTSEPTYKPASYADAVKRIK